MCVRRVWVNVCVNEMCAHVSVSERRRVVCAATSASAISLARTCLLATESKWLYLLMCVWKYVCAATSASAISLARTCLLATESRCFLLLYITFFYCVCVRVVCAKVRLWMGVPVRSFDFVCASIFIVFFKLTFYSFSAAITTSVSVATHVAISSALNTTTWTVSSTAPHIRLNK